MIFSSLDFFIFFLSFFFLYFLLRKKVFIQNGLVLIGSFIFYGWWDWRFLVLMSFTICSDYFISKLIEASSTQKAKKNFLWLSILFNLSILGFFKYFNFFKESAIEALSVFGVTVDFFTLNIILPVGISFYTFQSLSYVVDVYRRQVKSAPSLIDYGAYVSLFPQLVAGPIERGTHLLPQILMPRSITVDKISEGSYLILWGLFKKVFIADNLSKLVDPVFSGTVDLNGATILVAIYAFAFQIYCDFSAYSDIARGVAKILGFDLMLNFNLPYFSKNPSEFWRRWHISLSTWLRDYLYKPLGGNKFGTYKTYRNLMITMALGGLWHGAQFTFIVWGLYQGLILVIHRLLLNSKERSPIQRSQFLEKITSILKIVFFFHVVCVGWLIFRAESVDQIYEFSYRLLWDFHATDFNTDIFKLFFYISPIIFVQLVQYNFNDLNFVFRLPVVFRSFVYLGIFYLVLTFGNFGGNEFIYFQF